MDETEAWSVWQKLDAAQTAEEAVEYKRQLRPYLETRKAAGQPFFPAIRQRVAQQQQQVFGQQDEGFEKLFVDGFDAYVGTLPAARQQTVQALLDAGSGRSAMQQTMAVQAWIASRQGIPASRVAESYPVWLARAGKTLGLENMTLSQEEEPFVYSKLVEKYVNRRQENLLLNGLAAAEGRPERTGMVHAAVHAALDRQPGPAAFAAWQAAAKLDKGYLPDHAARYQQTWNEIYSATRARSDPWRHVAEQTVATLMREFGREDAEPGGGDIANPAQVIAAAPKEARPLILALLRKEAERVGTGPDKGMAQQTGETFARRLTQMLGGTARTLHRRDLAASLAYIQTLQPGDVIGGRFTHAGDQPGDALLRVKGTAANLEAVPLGLLLEPLLADKTVTQEDIDGARKTIERQMDEMDIWRDLRGLAEGTLDPVTPANWFARKLWYPAVDTAAFQAAAAAGWGSVPVMLGGIADQRFDEYRQKYPDMKPTDALVLAQTQGALETGIEYLQSALLKRSFRGLGAAFTSAQGNAAAMFGKAALAGAAEQNLTEAIQDFTPMLLQAAASGLQEDIPDVDWTRELHGFVNSLGEREGGYFEARVDTALALLPAVIVGAAGGTVQTKLGRGELENLVSATTNERTMELAGIQQADRAAIVATQDPAARLDKFQAAYERRDPAVSRLALQRLAIEEDSRLVRALPVMERTEHGYTVDFGGEGKRAEYVDLATAQAARWEWVDAQGWQIVDETREAISLAEGALKIGTQLDVRFDARQRTLEQEMEGAGLSEAQAREAGIAALAAEGAQLSSEDKSQLDMAAFRILGSSETDFKEGVRRVVVRLYEGHTPLTVTEETTEDFARQMLDAGQRGFLEPALREFEQATGEQLLPAEPAATSDRHVIEAFSRVAVATLYGKSQAKDGPLPSWRGAMKGKLGGMIKALGSFLRAVFRRAGAIEVARSQGKLQGLALPDLIDQALGLDEQTRYDRAVGTEAAQIAQSLSLAGERAQMPRFMQDAQAKEARTGKTMSTLPAADIPAALAEMFSPFHADPKARREIGNLMQDRVFVFAREWQRASARKRTVKDLEAEARRIQAEAYDEYMSTLPRSLVVALGMIHEDLTVASQPVAFAIINDIGKMKSRSRAARDGTDPKKLAEYDGAPMMPPALFWGGSLAPDQVAQALFDMGLLKDAYPDTMWEALERELRSVTRRREEWAAARAEDRKARRAAREKAAAWLEQATAARAKDILPEERDRLVAGMKTLDAILSALPGEVRAKVGGTAKLAEVQTDAARLRYVQAKVDRISQVLEAWLREEISGQFEQLLRQAQPKGDKGEKIKGKIGVAGHAWFADVERIARMPAQAVDDRRAEIEGVLNQPESAMSQERQDDLVQEWLLLGTFGNFGNLTSAEMESALQEAEEVYRSGRKAWLAVLQQRREERNQKAAAAIRENAGPFSRSTEDEQARRAAGWRGQAAKAMSGFLGQIYSFGQTLGILFGDGATRQEYEARMNTATRMKREALLQRESDFQAALADAYGAKSRLQRQRALYDLQEQHDNTGVFFFDVKAKTEKIDVAAAERIVDGTMAQHGLQRYEVMELRWLLEANEAKPANERKEKLELTRVYRGQPMQKRLSRAQAMHIRMLWGMEEYHPSLARDGIGADTIEQIDAFLAAGDVALLAWLSSEYEAGYDRINAPFRRLYGAPLPRVRNYAPGTFQHDGDMKSLLPGEQELAGNMGAGFLRRRKNHASRMNLAMEDNVVDALSVYWRHVSETEHWIAFAELGDEMKSVFNRRDMSEAVRVNSGAAAAEHLRQWVEVTEKDGIRQGWANLQLRRWLNRFMAARSKVALGYKVSVWLKQSTAALATAFDLPVREFARSFLRAASGKAVISHAEAMALPIMQQRLASGSSPEWRMAMKEQVRRMRPGMLTVFADAGMAPVGWFDALFTGFSAAVAYDAHYRMSRQAGLSEDQARAEATQRADTSVARTAQPVETADKSLFELGLPALARPLFMFMSEARQKTALELFAVQRALGGRGNWADVGKAFFLNHVIFGSAAWLLGSLWRDMTNDDDEGGADDPAWEMSDWLFAMLSGPLAGLPLAGDIFAGFAELMTGHHGFQKDANPVAGSVTDVVKGVRSLLDEGGAKKGEELESVLRTAGKAAQAMSQVIGGDWAGLGSGVNAIQQVMEVGDNFVPFGDETKAKAERQARKDRAAKGDTGGR